MLAIWKGLQSRLYIKVTTRPCILNRPSYIRNNDSEIKTFKKISQFKKSSHFISATTLKKCNFCPGILERWLLPLYWQLLPWHRRQCIFLWKAFHTTVTGKRPAIFSWNCLSSIIGFPLKLFCGEYKYTFLIISYKKLKNIRFWFALCK